jgi:hypothetical protein
MIPPEEQPEYPRFGGNLRQVLKQVLRYHVPFAGDWRLLQYQPSTYTLAPLIASVDDIRCEIRFEQVNWFPDEQSRRAAAQTLIASLKTQYGHFLKEVEEFNSRLPAKIESAVRNRKKEFLAQLGILQSTGVPVRQASSVPATYAVPIHPVTLILKPSVPTTAFAPEPALDDHIYEGILNLVYAWGVEMERHPSIYADKGEEALRDLFLMLLSPHFHSTTGETFNKSGKTDILIRHEGKNAFVAECKFWRGIKSFHDAIDQLLGYLTCRDSKAAIICFVDNKELNPVMGQIVAETPKHACFVKDLGKKADSWHQYEFRLKDDTSRGVRLAVLCFHFPKGKEVVE